ncbi:universal stress protein [Dermacoccus sp. PAMC28757]|uniref:universal stress protein n=1 Tax=Dermacoccus sp. PAMC28757 TaxID=2762331 RepID=UPI00164D2E96|nr:universal stress protein [Dermacoccus sp. PAMC28757]QNK52287.1 universal stress protein [Dermacoccus sp. PAMC28757]
MSDSTVRYLVAWGGDARSKDALALGATLARTFRAELAVVYVVREETFGAHTFGDVSFTQEVVRQASEGVQKHLDALTDLDNVVLHVRRSGSVAEGVLDAAKEIDADLIVIGAGTGTRALSTNAIVTALLHASPVPVAMAPRGYRKDAPAELTELVAAVGPRAGAGRILEEAIRGVERVSLPLRLVSLLELGTDVDVPDERVESVRAALERAVEEVDVDEVTTQVGQGKNLKEAIANIEWKPDSALIIGSSRLAQGKQTFIGTVASRMLAHLPIPMIVAPRGE